jgi:hypothetical protein
MKPFRLTKPEPKEAQVLKAVLRTLELHPLIAFAVRMNSGATKTISGGWVKFGFTGCPDVWAMTKAGQLVVCEVKRPSGKATDEQKVFLQRVKENGGIAFIARSADDVLEALVMDKGVAE